MNSFILRFGPNTSVSETHAKTPQVLDRLTERTCLAVSVSLGLIHAWAGRYCMSPDGMSYLDIADAYLRHDWARALNGYWGPLYSFFLALTLAVTKPSITGEFPIVHLANFLIFLLALLSFRALMRSVLTQFGNERAQGFETLSVVPHWILLALGYGIFLWASLELISLCQVTPDLLLSALLYWIGNVVVQLAQKPSYFRFLVLGLLLGTAYFCKSVMFPLSVVILAITFLSIKGSKLRLSGVLLAGVVFLSVSALLFVPLSRSKGRFTFGDSGKLAYAWLVSPQPFWRNWQGQPSGSGIPLHATRLVLSHPPVYEFRGPIGGTYPPWYDPSYWNDGIQWKFDLVAQGRALARGTSLLARLIIEAQPGLLATVLVWLMMSWRNTLSALRMNWSLIGIGLVGIGIYLPVYVAERYIAAFLVLFGIAILAAIRLPSDENSLRMTKYVGIAGLAVVSLSLIATTFRVVARPIPDLAREDVDVAIALREIGLQEGDEVAVIGNGTGAYWARLARLRIVAEIMSGRMGGEEFWASSSEAKLSAYQAFAIAGAHAVVTRKPVCGLGPEWRRLAGTEYYIHSLSP